MLLLRTILAGVMVFLGTYILIQMLAASRAGWEIVPGVVLGAAMIALGVHRLRLIGRLRSTLR
jgi:hypothetical protein